jgi:hypothetical protein
VNRQRKLSAGFGVADRYRVTTLPPAGAVGCRFWCRGPLPRLAGASYTRSAFDVLTNNYTTILTRTSVLFKRSYCANRARLQILLMRNYCTKIVANFGQSPCHWCPVVTCHFSQLPMRQISFILCRRRGPSCHLARPPLATSKQHRIVEVSSFDEGHYVRS